MEEKIESSGYTCNRCGKEFTSKEEFIEYHKNKKEEKKEE